MKCHLVHVKTGLDGIIIPCKHFFAIFREHPEWSWESLPNKYRNSGYTSDNNALIDYFTNLGVSQEDLSFFVDNNGESSTSLSESRDNFGPNHNDQSMYTHDSVDEEALECEIPSKSQETTVKDSMLRARVTLKTLTYNFSDEDIQLAVEFTQKLDELYQYFYSTLPNEKGLIILTQNQESLRSTKRREHIHKNTDYANLPPRKKLKKSSEKRYMVSRLTEPEKNQRYVIVTTWLCIIYWLAVSSIHIL